jgi:N-acetylmuramic acid 6-phosphate etherase
LTPRAPVSSPPPGGRSEEVVNKVPPHLHELATADLLRLLRDADDEALAAAHAASEQVERVVEALVERWPRGGRLIYIGAGTSGRIGALDAAECGPTFGVPEGRVFAVLAGGARALAEAVEGAEDSENDGVGAMDSYEVGERDVVVGLSASGSTPFTCAALEAAGRRRAATVAVTCTEDSRLARAAAIAVILRLSGELIEGSTRMKAGTAQKIVCNAISTAAFVRLGRVWGRHMVAVRASSDKLRRRAIDILQHLDACPDGDAARALLAAAGDDLPTALVMALGGVARERAEELLERAHGDVHRALVAAGRSS